MLDQATRRTRLALLQAMREASLAMTGLLWGGEDIHYRIYHKMTGPRLAPGAKPLPEKLNAALDLVKEWSQEAEGWFVDEDLDGFIDAATWERVYKEWQEVHAPEMPKFEPPPPEPGKKTVEEVAAEVDRLIAETEALIQQFKNLDLGLPTK